MGGSPGKQETKNEPWEEQQPYLERGFRKARKKVLERPLEYYPGETTVDFSRPSREAMRMQSSRARSGSPLVRDAQAYTGDVVGGGYLGGSGAEGADASKMYDSILSQVEPAVASRWGRAGRMGGSPLAAEAFGRGASRAIAPYEFEAAEAAANRKSGEWMNERGMMESAAGRAPGLAREDYFDIAKLGEVGRMKEAKRGERQAAKMAKWNFEQNEPGDRIERYMRLISGNYGGTSTSRSTGGGANPFLTAMGAGLGLAGLPVQGAEGATSLGGSAIGK